MASDASFGTGLPVDHVLPGLREELPNLPPKPARRARRKPQDEKDALIRSLFENPVVGIAISSPDKRWVKVNDKWCEMIGYSREELKSLDWAALTHPGDLASGVALYKRLLSGRIRHCVMEKRYLRKNGEILYAEVSVTGVWKADGALKYIVALAVDTTQRKLAEQSLKDVREKLIKAQEQERVRIGRELHDEIGQRLALLAVDVDQLRKNPSRMPQGLQGLRSQVNEISLELQTLSHDLHAAKLEYLGAVQGIKSWCMEFGVRFKIRIDFSSNVRAPLLAATGVGLFRVVQEALQNVVRHSGADRAEVSLKEFANEVHLVIKDAGRGFDPREPREGLGLISMHERIRLLDGTVTVESALMRGTSILVRVPLHPTRTGSELRGH